MIFSTRTQLDDVLDRAARKLQLDNTRRARMESAYNAVASYLEEDEFFKDAGITIYPQGSVRIGTTVKPEGEEEFDLDTVVHLEKGWHNLSPFDLYEKIKKRLESNEMYNEKLQPKSRVLRLDYAGDFHMDIMPGCQAKVIDDGEIKIPDKKLKDWRSSNPKGFADWFESKYIAQSSILLEKAFASVDLPKETPYEYKQPIQRAVQLLKKHREIFIVKNPEYSDYKTSSIIITTIVGELYGGEDSIFETIDNIIQKILRGHYLFNGRIVIKNPINPDEVFTDKWEENRPKYEEAFRKYIESVNRTWNELKRGEREGFLNESELQKAFGGKTINSVLNEQKTYFQKSHSGAGLLPLTSKTESDSSLQRLASKSTPWTTNEY